MDLARRLIIAALLLDDEDSNEGPHFHERDDAFELPQGEFMKLFRLKKETAERLIEIVEENTVEPSRSSALDATVQVSVDEYWKLYSKNFLTLYTVCF